MLVGVGGGTARAGAWGVGGGGGAAMSPARESSWAECQEPPTLTNHRPPHPRTQALELDDGALTLYLSYLREGFFAGYSPPEELADAHALFQRLAERLGSQREGGAPPAEPAARAAEQPPHPGTSDEQGQQQEQQRQPAAAAYLLLGGAKRANLALPTSYAALLAACAPHVWLAPEALYELVWELEQSMVSAECEVSHAYNALEQARLARIRQEGAWLEAQRGACDAAAAAARAGDQ